MNPHRVHPVVKLGVVYLVEKVEMADNTMTNKQNIGVNAPTITTTSTEALGADLGNLAKRHGNKLTLIFRENEMYKRLFDGEQLAKSIDEQRPGEDISIQVITFPQCASEEEIAQHLAPLEERMVNSRVVCDLTVAKAWGMNSSDIMRYAGSPREEDYKKTIKRLEKKGIELEIHTLDTCINQIVAEPINEKVFSIQSGSEESYELGRKIFTEIFQRAGQASPPKNVFVVTWGLEDHEPFIGGAYELLQRKERFIQEVTDHANKWLGRGILPCDFLHPAVENIPAALKDAGVEPMQIKFLCSAKDIEPNMKAILEDDTCWIIWDRHFYGTLYGDSQLESEEARFQTALSYFRNRFDLETFEDQDIEALIEAFKIKGIRLPIAECIADFTKRGLLQPSALVGDDEIRGALINELVTE